MTSKRTTRIFPRSALTGALNENLLVAEYYRDGRILWANANFAAALHYDPDAVAGMNFRDLVSREKLGDGAVTDPLKNIDAERSFSGMVRFRAADGSHVWLGSIFVKLPETEAGEENVAHIAADVSNRIRDYMAENEETRKLSQIANETWNAVVIVDPGERMIYTNSGFTRVFGYLSGEVLGKPLGNLFGAKAESVQRMLSSSLKPGSASRVEEIAYNNTGQRLWASVVANPVFGADGSHQFTVCVITDITDAKMRDTLQSQAVNAMARDAATSEILELICKEIEAIIPEAAVAVVGVNEHGKLYPLAAPSLPENCRRGLTGLPLLLPESPTCRAVSTGVDVVEYDLSHGRAAPGPGAKRFLDAGFLSCWSSPIKISGESVGAVTLYYRERRQPDPFQEQLMKAVTSLCALAMEREKIRFAMRQITFYDAQTGLPNRGLLLANGDNLLLANRRDGKDVPTAVMCVNLSRFNQITGSLGYEAGSELLAVVAGRLAGGRYADDIVGRVGTEMFALVLPGCDEAKALILAERLLSALSVPCNISGVEINPVVRIGISLYPGNGYETESLLNAAMAAALLARSDEKRHFNFFSEEHNSRAKHRLSLESSLRTAIKKGELRLCYQPQVFFGDGSLHGVEALARWDNSEFGNVAPSRFIPLAEEAGFIDLVSAWVMDEACRQLGEWRKRRLPVPTVSINLSAVNFQDPRLPEQLREKLDRYGLTPSDLVIELTESVFLGDNQAALDTIAAISALGFTLTLDDFGTGYSSLGYIRRLPISEIKLDQSFVRDLESDAGSRRLSQAILHLGESLGLQVIVEGVETENQYNLLRSQGYHMLQGFYISEPLSPAELEKWLAFHQLRIGKTQAWR